MSSPEGAALTRAGSDGGDELRRTGERLEARAAALEQLLDVQERTVAEQSRRLERTVRELERSNRELELFAYVASHDLQEPLRMVASYTQLLERRYADQLDDTAREFIHFAVDGARRMQSLIEALLEYSRVQTRGAAFGPVPLDDVVAAVRENLHLRIAETGATLDAGPLPIVQADRTQMIQLFQNLIGNALKFHGGAPPVVHVEGTEPAGGWCRIVIRDEGIGIDPKHAGRIFQIFQRLHAPGEYPGTGIGLAICRRIVERHGGEIDVDSRPGEGAAFSFTLPTAGATP